MVAKLFAVIIFQKESGITISNFSQTVNKLKNHEKIYENNNGIISSIYSRDMLNVTIAQDRYVKVYQTI